MATRFLSLMLVALLFAACNGGSESDVGQDTPEPSITPSEAVIDEPTVVEAPQVSDQELVAAAVAELDASIADGAGPEETIAYDLMSTSVNDDGFVTLTICAWTGESVFDTVRDSLYRTAVSDDSVVTATHVTSPIAAGDCVNTELIDTAFTFIDAFDLYSAETSADPALFVADERSEQLLSASYYERFSETTVRWLEEDVYFEVANLPGDMRGSLQAEPLFRRYRFDQVGLLELVLCRPMNASYGIYRDGVLIDDEGSDSGPGQQSISMYQLEADPATDLGWRIAGDQGLIWADCLETGDWPGAANIWRPRDTPLEVLPQ